MEDSAVAVVSTGLNLLRECEAMAIEGAGHIVTGENLVAIAVHRIIKEKLYLEEKDLTGKSKYATFEAYLPNLMGKMGLRRSRLFALVADVRLATGPTLGLSYEDFTQLGGVAAFEAIKANVEYNQKTGEIYGFKDGYRPEGPVGTFIIEQLKDTDTSQPPDLIREEISHRLADPDKPVVEIQWYLSERKGGGYRAKYEKTIKVGGVIAESAEGYLDDAGIPTEIVDDFSKKLRVVGLYKIAG